MKEGVTSGAASCSNSFASTQGAEGHATKNDYARVRDLPTKRTLATDFASSTAVRTGGCNRQEERRGVKRNRGGLDMFFRSRVI